MIGLSGWFFTVRAASLPIDLTPLQATHLGMIDLAAFMGLECSEQQALFVWESHQSSEVHGDYTTHGLRPETIEWMNATMARLLPPVTALHWGVNPIDV